MRVGICAFAVFVAATGMCAAGDGELTGDELRKAVAGRTVHLETPLGNLPISYGANGTMRSSTVQLAAYTGSTADRGTWWVVASKLCQRWNNWLGGKSYCFTLRQQGNTVQWTRDDGLTGIAKIGR